MLCQPCAEIFDLSRPDLVEKMLDLKRKAVEWAREEQGYHRKRLNDIAVNLPMGEQTDEDVVKYIEAELDRYQDAVDQKAENGVPCPWAISTYHVESYDGRNIMIWKRSMHELKQAAISTNCDLCRRIVAIISHYTHGDVHGAVSVICYIEFNKDALSPSHLNIQAWGKASFQEMEFPIFLDVEHTLNDKFNPLFRTPQGPTYGEGCLGFLSNSLQECLAMHKSCSLGERAEWLPTRLLDVGDADDFIRLAEKADIRASCGNMEIRYFTLSHVWGTQELLRLTKRNYEDMKRRLSLTELPRCFRDAVHVSRNMSVRYLWIDSLCIIQDSPEDWAAEAATMHHVYRNGLCTLAACDTVDSRETMFVERNNASLGGPFAVTRVFASQTAKFTVVPDWVTPCRERAHLYSRGWTLQERYLSRRVMHFSEFPFFECAETCVKTEASRFELGFLTTVNRNFKRCMASDRAWLLTEGLENTLHPSIDEWLELVVNYSKTMLTYDKDKLVALSGIVKAFAEFLQVPYYAGIWGGDYLLESLLWFVRRDFDGNYRPEVGVPPLARPRGYRGRSQWRRCRSPIAYTAVAPSWSWASLDGNVCYNVLGFGKPLARVLSIWTTPADDDSFGRIVAGELVIHGRMFEVVDFGILTGPDCSLDEDSEDILSRPTFFVPLGHCIGLNLRFEVSGLFIQLVEQVSMQNATRLFTRVGHGDLKLLPGDYPHGGFTWDKVSDTDEGSDKDEGSKMGRIFDTKRLNGWMDPPWQEEQAEDIAII